MGKKRNTNKITLGVPTPKAVVGGGSVCGRDGKESDISDLESLCYSSVAGDVDTADEDENEHIVHVDSLGEQLEDAQDKKIGIRVKALDNVIYLFNKNFIPEPIEKWKMTIFEIVEKNLKRTPEEIVRSCTLAALVSMQLGVDVEDCICPVIAIMRTICADASASEVVRSTCAQAIGLCVYLSVEQFQTRYESLQTLKSVWSNLKPGGTDFTSLFSSSLYSWILLLERFDPAMISRAIEESQPKLCTFLDSITVEARISAGETLSIMHELAVANIDSEYKFRNYAHLKTILGELSLDSAKFRAKRDKKLQRMSFRQINDAIFNEKVPTFEIRFNKREKLAIEGCHLKLLYDLLCQLLKGDMNWHLTKNELLRQLFDLGKVLAEEDPQKTKAEKAEKMSEWGERDKQRNIHRSKFRAKKRDTHEQFED